MMVSKTCNILLCVLSIYLCVTISQSKSIIDDFNVQKWATTLGRELWRLGEIITKYSEIKERYKAYNAQITKKNPQKLLDEIVINITRMMDRKMDAILCIIQEAEKAAEGYEFNITSVETYTYFNSKCTADSESENGTCEFLSLNEDTHFYNVPVNTSYSSVHVPTNIYDKELDVAFAIQWSEALDKIFKQNYRSDPALSWQYFGSSTGIMRHYPAMNWIEDDVDTFDCRTRTWFIEASTCTKDVVLLLDNSGSMTGMRKHIAAFTVKNILDTFSNNDYINLLNYSTTVDYIVPCFKDQLIQATRENIAVFKSAVEGLEANQKSQLKDALTKAFELLKEYRKKRGCSDNSSDCNQAIMLLTDGVPKNMSDVLSEFNFLNNGSSIPVRIFTFLIGKEVTNVDEIMWMACANRGYYTHIQTLEQVTGAVFKYIPVVARPLVLQQVEHPPSWTHAYVDITYNDETDIFINEPYRLLTTVAAPAYDTKLNNNNESRTAELLGVAATDVPIDDIRKLTSPYRIGVNGYAFVLTNNGYILWHPALKPMLGKILKENFNSVDFTEVEQLDDDLNAREIGETLLKLRNDFVSGGKGIIKNITLKYHYDNTRRITRAKYDYYYASINNTPFTVVISIPHNYGQFIVEVGDVIQKNKHTGEKLTQYFNGSNWKIHPKWVYCKYHYLEGHEFSTPENELLHFLNRTYNRNFKWRQQYEPSIRNGSEREDFEKIECGRKTLGDDDYYCDIQLMQSLIFDAQSTFKAFEEPWKFKHGTGDRELFEKYNATLRFVATMSGLTRWEYIYGENENNNEKEFGDQHARAIDEQWYKSAILQHEYDKLSFVFSVPFDLQPEEDVLVTGSYAIFPEDAGIEAPGSVVGFQFSHAKLRKRFNEILNNCVDAECYLIDHSGYIVVANDINHTGRFFGEIEGEVMYSMIQKNIYINLTVYDYQALCLDPNASLNAAAMLLKPLDYLAYFFNVLLSKIIWIIVKTNIYQLWDPNIILADSVLESAFNSSDNVNDKDIDEQVDDEAVVENDEEHIEEEKEPIYRSCDKHRTLYFLNQTKFIAANPFPAKISTPCNRPYYIHKVIHSNLLLVVVEPLNTCDRKFNTDQEEIIYPTNVYQCQKLNLNNLTRRRLKGCFNEHPLEREITACGKSSNIFLHINLSFIYYIFIGFICMKYILCIS